MSIDVAIWKFEPGFSFDGQATYEMLCAGTEVEGLHDLDVGAYLTQIAAAYPTATRCKDAQIIFDGVSWKFLISWSMQHIHVTFYGSPSEADADTFLQIADELGCWTYHPTSGELFAAEGMPTQTSTPQGEIGASLNAAIQLFKEDTCETIVMASAGGFNVGDRVGHPTYGSGTVFRFEQMQTGTLIIVDFDEVGRKGLLLAVAPLNRF
jgi:hypothetical protein